MKFNPEINLGTIIEICVFILAVIGAIRKVSQIEFKVNMMYDWFMRDVIHAHRSDEGD